MERIRNRLTPLWTLLALSASAGVASAFTSVAFVIASAAAGLPLDSVEQFSILNAVLPAVPTV